MWAQLEWQLSPSSLPPRSVKYARVFVPFSEIVAIQIVPAWKDGLSMHQPNYVECCGCGGGEAMIGGFDASPLFRSRLFALFLVYLIILSWSDSLVLVREQQWILDVIGQ